MTDTPANNGQHKGQKMWGGRFNTSPDVLMQQINASIGTDKRMWREDIEGSKAHSAMLGAVGILTAEDVAAIHQGLDEIAAEIEAGSFNFSVALEDIHLNIESALTDKIGDAGKRLHTGRSRNDQVATDFKLWVRRALGDFDVALTQLQATLAKRAKEQAANVMPGFTHLQTAQPVTMGHHLLAYVEMFARDRKRIAGAIENANECPLGSAALAGTPWPIDRHMTAKALGFAAPMNNSMDGVGARDFAMEALNVLAVAMVHLSRLAEELVLWTSPHFGFARLSDGWSTGSSIMPQKRNPDAAELIRAKAAKVSAAAGALMMTLKALPLTYAKDLQDDKTITFAAFDDAMLSFAAMDGMMDTIVFNAEKMAIAAGFGYATATDLADWLVRETGLPFREAHHVTGAVVARAERLGISDLTLLPLSAFQAINPNITQDAIACLTVAASAGARTSFGGTAPENVAKAADVWLASLAPENGSGS